MNEMPPQQPPYTPPPTTGQPLPVDAGDPTKRLKIWLAVVSVLALALIVGAYLFGKQTGEDNYKAGEPGYQEIYNAGVADGAKAGATAGQAKGQAEGKAEGVEEGKQQGVEEGEAQGTEQGAEAALGGLTGWSTDAPYVVEFDEGTSSSVPYVISKRWLMQPGVSYKICSSGEGVCQSQSGGGSTGSTP